ncbi:MAG: ROK family protein, partial [Actinomycetes bacterium]
ARTEPVARALLQESLAELALHVANAAILVDPARITVGGGLADSADVVMPALAAVLERAAPFVPELVLARFVHNGPLVGAGALAWEAVHAR